MQMVVILLDIANRIFALLEKKGIEQKQFAVLLGTTDKTVSAWKTGRSKSYTKCMPQIAEILGTTVEYLLTGNGPKMKIASADVPESDTVSPDERDLLAAYQQAGPELQAAVRRVLGLE